MTTEKVCPPVTSELLAWLEGTFPDSLPQTPQPDLAEVNVRIGTQKVIRKLRQEFNKQHADALTGTTR